MQRASVKEAVVRGSWIPLILFLLPLAVYSFNLCPSLWWMDSGEFVFHSTVLGIPHPTGYPLYIQLGKLFTLFPAVGDAIALNFFSALMAALTIPLLYRILLALGGERWSSAGAALLFGLSFTFWSQAEIAEVYALHTFFLAVITLLMLKSRAGGDRRVFYLLAFTIGLSLTHHMSTTLMFPSILLFLWVFGRDEILKARVWIPSVLFFAAGLSVYLFIPMRAHLPPPFNYPMLHGVDPGRGIGLFWLITGRIVKADMFQFTLSELDQPITFFLVKLIRDFVYIGFILGIYGALVQYKAEPRLFLTFLVAFLAYVVFFVDYGVVDQHVFFIPSFFFWTLWIGLGLSDLYKRIPAGKGASGKSHFLKYGFRIGLLLMVLFPFLRNHSQLDYSDQRGPDEFALRVLDRVSEGALISSIYEATPLLWYHHYVRGIRPDVEIMDRGLMSLNVRQEMLKALDSRSPVFELQVGRRCKRELEEYLIDSSGSRDCYLVKYDPFLNDRFFLQEIDRGLYRVIVKEDTGFHDGAIPEVSFPGGFRYAEQIDILGLDLDREVLTEGDLFRIRIFWSAVKPLQDRFVAILRYLNDVDLEEHEREENSFIGIYTLGGIARDPDALVPGRVIADEFDGYVPPDTREGDYGISLALIEEERFYAVPKDEQVLDYLNLGAIPVRGNPEFSHDGDS